MSALPCTRGSTLPAGMVGRQSYEEVIPLSKRPCKQCGSGHMRRLNRRGWTQLQLLPMLGIFPWECTLCRSRTFRRDNGQRAHREPALNGPF